MAVFKLGRVQVLAATDTWGVKAWNASGNKVSLSGVIYAPGITNAQTLRAQLLGHVDNLDEEVVPVTWAADPTVDGYYRVLGAAVNMRGPSLAHGWFEVSLDLERVPSYATPVFESVLTGATLTNGLTLVGSPWLGVPNEVDGHSITSLAANDGRVGADGTVRLFFFSTYTVVNRYQLPPADYYKNAATFEVGDAASNYQVVTGTQCENKPELCRLSNGLVRVVPVPFGRLDISHFDGTTWETAKRWNITYSGQTMSYQQVMVLRNSPEEVVIRLTANSSVPYSDGRVTIDVALRRGDAIARIFVTSQAARAWACLRDVAEAGTSFTGGIRASADDASGNRYALFSATATTKDTTQGALTLPVAATTADFGIGNSIGGSGATGPNVIVATRGMVEQYFAAQAEVMGVAGQ